ncbi:MAG: 50S ribosomal protein L9 [Ardenticatenia bacterium]|nr:50S ribosomal protein L9 [Ardenticatenia bacterium]
MEVLLLQDVPNLGQAGEIKTVSNGYARNYLIPKGLAKVATPGVKKQAEQIRRAAEKRRQRERQDAEALAQRIGELLLRFEAKVGETGRLYGSVTAGDIAERLSETLGVEIDRRALDLGQPIRQLGTYEVPVRLMADCIATVRVEVVGEHGETAESIAAAQAEAQATGEEGTEGSA